jgi:S-adenosylmethionine hydrolase
MLITLTTDFGPSSPYVAAMKGVILSLHPKAQLVDLTHGIAPQDIFSAAQVLVETTPLFPPDTLHLVVVDPGVGTDREIVYAQFSWGCYLCPDNGLLGRLAERADPTIMVTVTAERFFRTPVAPTFHGRDILAPVAAQLSLGLDPRKLGPPHPAIRQLPWPQVERVANQITGEIVAVDSFGNLVTNITRAMLADVPTDDTVSICCDSHQTTQIFTTYADQPPLTLVALIGSSDQLELAIVDDSAKLMLGVAVGAPVEVRW